MHAFSACRSPFVRCAQSATLPAPVLSVVSRRSPSLSPAGLDGDIRPAGFRSSHSARNGWISVRSPPGSQCPQSQTHEPSISTRSPGSGQAKVGIALDSSSVCILEVSSPPGAKLPVRAAGSPPISASYGGSGRTSTFRSYERWVVGMSPPAVCTDSSASSPTAFTTPFSHCGGGGGPLAGAFASPTYAHSGTRFEIAAVSSRPQPSATAWAAGSGRVSARAETAAASASRTAATAAARLMRG